MSAWLIPICGRAEGWLSIFTTIAGRFNVVGSVFGKPVSELTTTWLGASVTTVVSPGNTSDVPDEPPQAANANNEDETIELNMSERIFMFRSL